MRKNKILRSIFGIVLLLVFFLSLANAQQSLNSNAGWRVMRQKGAPFIILATNYFRDSDYRADKIELTVKVKLENISKKAIIFDEIRAEYRLSGKSIYQTTTIFNNNLDREYATLFKNKYESGSDGPWPKTTIILKPGENLLFGLRTANSNYGGTPGDKIISLSLFNQRQEVFNDFWVMVPTPLDN